MWKIEKVETADQTELIQNRLTERSGRMIPRPDSCQAIIAIMNESFTDFTRCGRDSASSRCCLFIDSLQENTVKEIYMYRYSERYGEYRLNF